VTSRGGVGLGVPSYHLNLNSVRCKNGEAAGHSVRSAAPAHPMGLC
jgi:hypothetical protein